MTKNQIFVWLSWELFPTASCEKNWGWWWDTWTCLLSASLGPPEETEDCWELSKQPLVPASFLLFSGLLSGERMVVEWCAPDMGHRWPEPHACLPTHLSQSGPHSLLNSTSRAAFSVMGCECIYGMTEASHCPLSPPGVAVQELSGRTKSSWPH